MYFLFVIKLIFIFKEEHMLTLKYDVEDSKYYEETNKKKYR